MDLYILKRPVITEKSYRLVKTQNAYTFEVSLESTKGQVKEVVEKTFNVKVLDVHTTVTAGKVKTKGKKRLKVRQPDQKKAIVKLAPGQTIELFEVEGEQKA